MALIGVVKMHIDGLRRRRLALLKKKRTDLRFEMAKHSPTAASKETEEMSVEDQEISKEIGVLECARRDLI